MMNKRTFAALVLIAGAVFWATAQEAAQPAASTQSTSATAGGGFTELYPVNVPIARIYAYRDGYVVTYNNRGTIEEAFVPTTWFKTAGNTEFKAEKVLLGPGMEWPHMTVYYKDGAFARVRLYVRKEPLHDSWGYIPAGSAELDDHFKNAQSLDIKYK